MRSFHNEKSPTGRLGISKNIHIEGVNGLQVITNYGVTSIDKFVREALKHHQELLAKFDLLVANDYPELDYSLHKMLVAKEIKLENAGGNHG